MSRPTVDRPRPDNRLLALWMRTETAWQRVVAPRPSGLPNLLVLVGFPVVALLIVVVLVALGVSGNSSGVYWQSFGTGGADPDLLAGRPQGIRSDEWLVQSSWILSQVREGFPVVNQSFPGGMDATIQNDLPTWDWSSLFRPHVVGFLFLPLDQGMAVRWWLPVVSALIAAYVFAVTVMPRRPATAAFLAIALCLSPMIQWWFLPTTIWPVAWAFAGLTAVLWAFRSSRRWPAVVAAVVTGYLTVTMVMSIYVPYMVPAAVVLVAVAVGFLVERLRTPGTTWWRTVRSLVPLAFAAAGAVVVIGVWALTRLDTIKAVLGTVYPGQRLELTGATSVEALGSLFSGPFQRSLQYGAVGGLSVNQSEAAAPLMVVVFLLPALLWVLWAGLRRRRAMDWPVLATVVVLGVLFAFLLVPHWDAVAHLLLLDRSTDARIRLAFDLLGLVAVALVAARLDAGVGARPVEDAPTGDVGAPVRSRVPWGTAGYGPVLVLVSAGFVYIGLRIGGSNVLGASHAWRIVVVLLAVGVLLVARRWIAPGALLLLVAAVVVGGGVNPLYRGVFDLATQTTAGKAVSRIVDRQPDARWVGIGGYVPTAMLLETGAHSYNGVQTYPPEEMWHEIDPSGRYEPIWNRLANVNWLDGDGAPKLSLPVRDQIRVSFDGCSRFAQQNVQYVLSDQPVTDQCVSEVREVTQGQQSLWIYRVDRR
ncbi:hypothetical protein [Curtobacterium sp. VKM Ac-2922]|uniref:DUF7657 domain-containing protein n=1 Tax=Curtobacterium sp. VKM Ac-2922 TaxID=2929475 RepID=UPI001FB42C55|nr:hypothetical protein [Curtobacterium sp. VKM Ac-2922]MCJ1713356.1 hypothetical protein [Curtobacterium sp. VKM Ac-2922]